MRAAEWKRVSQPVGEVLPGFRPIKFGFVREHEWVAECLTADSSGFSGAVFYLEAFAVPLFVPTDGLYYDYGFRIGRGWDAVTSELVEAVRAAMPRLSELGRLDGLLAAADDWKVSIYQAELRLCIAVLTDDAAHYGAMRDVIREWTATIDWEAAVLERCEALVRVVEDGGFSRGDEELARRREDVRRLLV